MSDITISEKEFWQIVSLLKDHYGINLSQKKNLIVGRLQKHLRSSNYSSFSEFYDYVISDRTGEAATLLINKLTTNYTFFMREIEHFDFFRGTALPHIARTEKSKDMRIWSAGCASGEEPYSIAMCIADFFAGGGVARANAAARRLGGAARASRLAQNWAPPRAADAQAGMGSAQAGMGQAQAGMGPAQAGMGPAQPIAPPGSAPASPPIDTLLRFESGVDRSGWDSKVLATDISERVLAMASDGIYMAESLDPLPSAWRRAFFKPIDDESEQVVDWLRREIIFRKFNLMEEHFPFRKKFHIIWCRNVMIYFDAETRKRLIEKFYDFTEPGGYLFIGHSESIARNETRYTYVMPAIYRRDP